MNSLERFDQFLVTIVSETGGVEGLLHSMFSFLFRRTDFFYEMMPGEKMGFLPGEAERMVKTGLNKVATIFKTYQNEYFKKHPPKDPKEVQKKLEELKKKQLEAKTSLTSDTPKKSNESKEPQSQVKQPIEHSKDSPATGNQANQPISDQDIDVCQTADHKSRLHENAGETQTPEMTVTSTVNKDIR